jgi:hypothetical protein
MKKMIFFMMLLIWASTSFSQQTNLPQKMTREDYLAKSKRQHSGAWVLLGGGAALILVGDLVGNNKNSSFGDAGTGVIVAGIGVLSMLGSIPLFIAAGKNKRRGNALSASIDMENAETIQGYSLVHSSYPAICIKVRL